MSVQCPTSYAGPHPRPLPGTQRGRRGDAFGARLPAGAVTLTSSPMRLLLIPIVALLVALPALANHGPGTSGGGSSTISGETLKAGHFDLSFRTDYTEFEHISRAEAE